MVNVKKMNKFKISQSVKEVIEKLEAENFEAFVVGGCVRDLLLGREPKDWDVTTNARPEEILKIFPDGKYENNFGTVLVPEKYLVTSNQQPVTSNNIEITTYRIESKYSDKRHPDEIRFANTLEEDLGRRDFTINALALRLKAKNEKRKTTTKKLKQNKYEVIDLFDGRKDLEKKLIRAVGKAEERFDEDALRMMRAVRFVSTLGSSWGKREIRRGLMVGDNKIQKPPQSPFSKRGESWKIEKKTLTAIKRQADNLKYVSQERIRDELEKIILSSRPAWGIDLLMETGLMKHIIPELYQTIDVRQNRHHYHGPYNTVYKHLLASLEKCPSAKLEVRLAAWLHDIGKPKTKEGEGELASFHAHEYAGAHLVKKILERLRFPRKVIDKTVLLVRNHMFYYNVDEVGEKGVRKVIRKVGLENINDLIDVRIGDRLGSGVPKAVPYRLRHFQYMVDKVSTDPISVGQLKIDGNILMGELKIKPGPKIGAILEVLLAQVIDDPRLNEKEELLKLARRLEKEDLNRLRQMAKEKIKQERKKEDEKIKGKHWVQ